VNEHEYVGTELGVFALATNWKSYFGQVLRPFVRGTILEVGAGIGATTVALWHDQVESWTCLEPDPSLAKQLRDLRLGEAEEPPEVIVGTVADISPQRQFDSIMYIDVLEHIENDRTELARAAAHLRPGGSLIVLSPAFNYLFSPFDRAIGHYRRYTRRDLRDLAPAGLELGRAFYLDSCGALLSLANRLLLRQHLPTRRQILFWDRRVIPISRASDRVFSRWWGRSVITVYFRPA
jgi:SAM-dependent methyltransferase